MRPPDPQQTNVQQTIRVMGSNGRYVSRIPGPDGTIDWSQEDHQIWHELITRQLDCIRGKACDEYVHGLEQLDLPTNHIPQLGDLNEVLRATTGWECVRVPALIGFDEFFRLLSNRRFPVATFIRSREELEYLQEPDIFHEIFGHCPMLTHPAFAEFTHTYGQLGYAADKEDRVWLARLYWFTVEFGMLATEDGVRIYGGGILSSPGETHYAWHSDKPARKPFEMLDVLRTPYRIDEMQPVYFVINAIDELFSMACSDIMRGVASAKTLGLHACETADHPMVNDRTQRDFSC